MGAPVSVTPGEESFPPRPPTLDGRSAAPLTVMGLCKRWPGRSDRVLDGIDMTLADGSLTWLAGDNGAGKTTLVRAICGLLGPDAGTVLIRGRDMEQSPRECKRRIGLLSAASSGLYARLTSVQQLDYWARLAFVPARSRAATVARTLDSFGIGALAHQRLDRMSMGERQRVRLAMAFIHEPDVVLLDEPRNSLDRAGLDVLADALARHRDQGGAALWCAPSGERPEVPLDRSLVIAGGRLVPA